VSKDELEKANRELAAQWAEGLEYANVDIADALQYDVVMILGRIWKAELDEQRQRQP